MNVSLNYFVILFLKQRNNVMGPHKKRLDRTVIVCTHSIYLDCFKDIYCKLKLM